ANGNVGMFIAEALLKTGKHVVTAISREGSGGKLPNGVLVKRVDYDDHASLVDALRGQDILIITMGVFVPEAIDAALIRAAADAGVAWVIPNGWTYDYTEEGHAHDVPSLSRAARSTALISEIGKSSFISVAPGFWYEWSLSMEFAYGVDLKTRTAA
ncbi:hypothetical protein HK405_005713, partial [Cladochytrium tenue]